jgi:hypothetical protein
VENWIKAAAGSIALKRGEPVGAALNFHKSFFTRQANVVNGTNKSLRRNRRDFRSENAPYLKTLARDAVLLRNANSIYQATTQDIFVQRTFPIITRVERSWPCYSGQVYNLIPAALSPSVREVFREARGLSTNRKQFCSRFNREFHTSGAQ